MMSMTYMVRRQIEALIPSIPSSILPSWLKPIIDCLIGLVVFGVCTSAYKACRTRFGSWTSIRKVLFPTTTVFTGGAYHWISSYVYQDADVQGQFRDRIISAEDEDGQQRSHKNALRSTKSRGSKSKSKFETWSKGGVVATIRPVNNQDLLIRFKNKNIWLTKHSAAGAGGSVGYWSITTWFWNKDLIEEFILVAHGMYYEKTDKEIHIYNHLLGSALWTGPLRRPTRAWESVILPATVKEKLLRDVEQFVSEDEKAWYALKGIPHRRGYLLHGPPGTGKTTLATAVASKLGLSMYCVSPAAAGMDNSKLERLFQTCPPGSLLFIEDIDCVMPVKRVNGTGGSSAIGVGKSQVESTDKSAPPSSVTLSGLLNAIDGVASQEDSVLFASTNFPENLDASLRRPGRFDVDLKFDFATPEQAMDIYKHFYSSTTHVFEKVDDSDPSSTSRVIENSRIDDEAQHFAKVIKEADIKVSIATIEGFLLLYKREPEMVQAKVEEWAAGIRAEQFLVIEEENVVPETVEQGLRKKSDHQVAGIGKDGMKVIKEKKKLIRNERPKQGVQKQETVLPSEDSGEITQCE